MIQTINKTSQYHGMIKKSDFQCYLHPVSDIEQARQLISEHNHSHAGATHNCYTYNFSSDRQIQFMITIPIEKLQDWKTLLDNYSISDSISYSINDT